VNTVVAPGTSGTLVLAEAAGGWSATLDGKPLAALRQPVDGWAQGFVLPAGGGRLVITRDELARDLSLGGEAAAVIVVFALALPGTRAAASAVAGNTAGDAAGEAGAAPDENASPAPARRRERAGRPKLPARRRQQRPQPAAFTADRPREAVAPGRAGFEASEPSLALVSGAEITAPRRSRGGGQHAAKHGKPPRRWRGPAQTPAIPVDPAPAPAPDPVLETAVSVPAADDGTQPHNPVVTGQRPPWELGDP
jgi:hypothetical protein